MSKKQVYVSFIDGQYRVFRPYDSISVDDTSTTHFRVVCTNPARTLLFNKGCVKFIDVGDIPYEEEPVKTDG